VADTDLPISGKDCSVVLTYDGAVIGAAELVEVEVDEMTSTTKTKPLGTTTTLISTDFEGWRIRLRLDASRKDAAELIDLITSGEILRVPALMGLSIKESYRNFDTRTETYLDIKRTSYRKSHRRDEASREEITFETGLNRIVS